MRILIVSALFPPFANIGSTRVGKTAKVLREFGHDVRVLTCKDHALPETAPLEIPPENVHYAPAFNLHRPSELVQGGRRAYVDRGGRRTGLVWDLLYRVWNLYKTVAYIPDQFITWVPFAVIKGRRLIGCWRPDVILASGPPPSAYLVGRSLSRRSGIPWIADLRDPWTDNFTYAYNGIRRRWEISLERRVLKSAAALITVTEPWAETLRTKHRRPAHVVYNGFDPEELPPERGRPLMRRGLNILFTGSYYAGLYDIGPLMDAIGELQSPDWPIRLTMVGNMVQHAAVDTARSGRCGVVETLAPVERAEALAMQAEADVLLLLNAPGEHGRGLIPAKLFEYLASRRPILALTPSDGAAGALIEQLQAGRAVTTRPMIREVLDGWLATKRETGQLPSPPEGAAIGFSRSEQVGKLAQVLEGVRANSVSDA